ncbi:MULTISPECIES: hypothetical protein [Paracoccus]|uniref:Uncharacterized protein n=1 Tax=Paracoccus kondratievae TaxID=135740 RepID=A0AAD3RTE5_9RHOB|nr:MULTISPECIES: hypothetical protein [Paracoccus]GLK63554.1 hypothetical protein GCM10017635_10240 [Paracoccus kondratievae]SMG30110.1 hypothetical protein SAMN02746000_01765 [Paracoccus sp. J56]
MIRKPSNSEVKQAIFDERRALKAAADIFDDRGAVSLTDQDSVPVARPSWEQQYDALSR